MATREQWATAYYRQALSDWRLYKELSLRADVPPCQALHFLQMATEKLAKAFRFRDTATEESALLTRHVGFHQFMKAFLLSPQMRLEYAGRHGQLTSILKNLAPLTQAIERLAPAVARYESPGNAEYPWAMGDAVIAPVDHPFDEVRLLRSSHGRTLLKFIAKAFEAFPVSTP